MSLPASWSAQDIGAPAISGGNSYNQGTFTISAAGADVWGSSDQFRFVYQQISGDVEVIARVDSITQADLWSKAGVMIRASLAASSAHAFMLLSAAHGMAFQYRDAAGGQTASIAGSLVATPQWVRIVRLGTKVYGYSSADGATWSQVGVATIALGTTAYVGLAVTSHNAWAPAIAALSHVAVIPLTVPAPQRWIDIGAPAPASSVLYRLGLYDVTAGGADIWGTSDQFNYVYQPISGDFDVSARVDAITNTATWAKTGIMVRESLTANSPHAYALLSAAAGFAFQRRVAMGGFSVNTSGPASALPGWVRLVRSGSTFTAFSSLDGTTWVSMGSDAIPMANSVYVGIATTSHNTTTRTEALVERLTIVPAGGVVNEPPIIAITSPSAGSTFTAGTTVAITAAASDSDGTIARVDFFAGTTLIGSDASAPYAAAWPSVGSGTYTLTAVAVDNDGARAVSATSTIAVAGPPTAVMFHKSADDSTLVVSYELRIFSSSANPDTATPLARSNLGKPASDANGDITVDQTAFFSSLANGSYVVTIAAVGTGGSSQSAGVAFTK